MERDLVIEQPYTAGWIVQVTPLFEEELESLLTSGEYKKQAHPDDEVTDDD